MLRVNPSESADPVGALAQRELAAPEVRPDHWWRRASDALTAPTVGPALVVWLGTRLAVYVTGWYASWALAGPPMLLQGAGIQVGSPTPFPELWNRWDALHFQSIAGPGYGSVNFETNYAFFPGFPMVMRMVALTGVSLTVAGLIVSLVAGLAAAIALGRLTIDVGGRPEMGVLAWALAPAAVYLAAPYSEALFCAFAFWAWVMVRRGAWVWASILAMLASCTRVNGLFLAVAVVVAFLTSRQRQWSKAPALVLPFAGVLGVFAYYHALTGSWSTWSQAMEKGWGRRALMNPWDGFTTILDYATHWELAAPWVVQYRFDIFWTFTIAIVGVVLLFKRWWGEATFALVTAASLATTSWGSVPRYALIIFPIWMLLGLWMSNSRVVRLLYVCVAGPLMIVSVAVFVNGYWVS